MVCSCRQLPINPKSFTIRRSYRGNGRGIHCVTRPLDKLIRAIAECAGNKHVRGTEQRMATETIQTAFLEENRVLGTNVTHRK
jgi:hypothetical protein